MADTTRTTRFRFWLWLIRFIGVIVPRRFRDRFRKEWEAELEYREELLAGWDRLDWRNKLELLWRSLGAFWDALWLQPQRLEDEMFQDLRFGLRMLLEESRLHVDCRAHAGAGHWREHGDLQRRQCADIATAPLSRLGAARLGGRSLEEDEYQPGGLGSALPRLAGA